MARTKIDADEVCPVCKSSRYLNPNMKFMIEPSCYHKMCESCVDRIFSSGPAPCPVAGCGKTLRKARFKYPNFEDLAIEREVDIRQRVARVLNRREAEFETLRDFNDYEEKKEDIIWNLVKGIDVEATEKELTAYARENKSDIARNKALEEAESASVRDAESARLQHSALAREAARKEVADEKADREANRKAVVDRLAAAPRGDAAALAQASSSSATAASRKLSSLRRGNVPTPRETNTATASSTIAALAASGSTAAVGGSGLGLGFRGLKKVDTGPVAPEAPYDPFGGLVLRPRYFTLQDSYEHAWSDRARTDPMFTAGGYDVREYFARAQLDAHAGLGVFVGEEKRKREEVKTG